MKNSEKHRTNLYRKQESQKRRETRENNHTRIHITRKAFGGALFNLIASQKVRDLFKNDISESVFLVIFSVPNKLSFLVLLKSRL